MKIIINALIAKKNAGGGFQIAFNFIKQTLISDRGIEWYYLVSKDLDDVLNEHFSSLLNVNYFVFPNQPKLKSFFKVRENIRILEKKIKPDLVYSILAPSYFTFESIEVMRIANAWNTNRNHYAMNSLSLKQKMFFSAKGVMSRSMIKKSNYFVTQTNTLKKGIIRVTKVPDSNVKVISNVLPLIYNQQVIQKTKSDKIFNIVYVAASAAHKKIDLIPFIAKRLIEEFNFTNFKIYVTIPFESPFNTKFEGLVEKNNVKDYIENVGYQTQTDLINLYSKCNIGFFPSLLETFSATLLEYMKFELPIVASNFEFNRDIAQDAALYFEPNNVKDATRHLFDLMNDRDLFIELQSRGKKRLDNYSDYSKHFDETVDFFLKILKTTTNKT